MLPYMTSIWHVKYNNNSNNKNNYNYNYNNCYLQYEWQWNTMTSIRQSFRLAFIYGFSIMNTHSKCFWELCLRGMLKVDILINRPISQKFSRVCATYRTVKEGVSLVINVDNSASSSISKQLPNPGDCCPGISSIMIQLTNIWPVLQRKVAQLSRLKDTNTHHHHTPLHQTI